MDQILVIMGPNFEVQDAEMSSIWSNYYFLSQPWKSVMVWQGLLHTMAKSYIESDPNIKRSCKGPSHLVFLDIKQISISLSVAKEIKICLTSRACAKLSTYLDMKQIVLTPGLDIKQNQMSWPNILNNVPKCKCNFFNQTLNLILLQCAVC